MDIRTATLDDLPDVLNVLDGALLDVDISTLERALEEGGVLLAVESDSDARTDEAKPHTERLLGVVVLDEAEIVAIAVRRRRRTQGIGTTLVETATERHGALVAKFDERVRPFWESFDATIQQVEGSNRFAARIDRNG